MDSTGSKAKVSSERRTPTPIQCAVGARSASTLHHSQVQDDNLNDRPLPQPPYQRPKAHKRRNRTHHIRPSAPLPRSPKCFFEKVGELVFDDLYVGWPAVKGATMHMHARYLVSSDIVPRHLRVLLKGLKANTGTFDDISGRQRPGEGFVVVIISVAGARLTNSIRPGFGSTARDTPAFAGLNGLYKLKIPFPSCLSSRVPRPTFFECQ